MKTYYKARLLQTIIDTLGNVIALIEQGNYSIKYMKWHGFDELSPESEDHKKLFRHIVNTRKRIAQLIVKAKYEKKATHALSTDQLSSDFYWEVKQALHELKAYLTYGKKCISLQYVVINKRIQKLHDLVAEILLHVSVTGRELKPYQPEFHNLPKIKS